MNNFQTILVSVFLAIFAFAVLIFSGLLDIGNKIGKNKEPAGKIIVWGTVPSTDISKAFLDITSDGKFPDTLNFIGVMSLGSSFGDEVLPKLAAHHGNRIKIMKQ